MGESHRFSLSYRFEPLISDRVPVARAEPVKIPVVSPTPSVVTVQNSFRLTALPHSLQVNEIRAGKNFKLVFAEIENIERTEGIVVHILDSKGNTVIGLHRRFPGTPELYWNGKTTQGKWVGPGDYLVTARLYEEGRRVTARRSLVIKILNQEKKLELKVDKDVFAPIIQSERKKVSFVVNTSVPDSVKTMEVLISNSKGVVVRSIKATTFNRYFSWDGFDAKGKVLEDGVYHIAVKLTDEQGSVQNAEVSVEIDTRRPNLALQTDSVIFTPGDKMAPLMIYPRTDALTGISYEWYIKVTDFEGNVQKAFKGQGSPPPQLAWDGYTGKGSLMASEALYYLQFELIMESGAIARTPRQILISDFESYDIENAIEVPLAAVAFDQGSAAISLDRFRELKKVADAVRKYGTEYRVKIIGHASSQESSDNGNTSVELSRSRASAIRDYLVHSEKLDPVRIRYIGYGELRQSESVAEIILLTK